MTNKAAGLTGPYVAGDMDYVPPPPVDGGGTRATLMCGLGISIISGGTAAPPTKTLSSWVDSDNWVDSDPWVD